MSSLSKIVLSTRKSPCTIAHDVCSGTRSVSSAEQLVGIGVLSVHVLPLSRPPPQLSRTVTLGAAEAVEPDRVVVDLVQRHQGGDESLYARFDLVV